jgi:hypothetical protein
MGDKIRILFFGANPVDVHPLQIGKEVREIEAEIRTATRRDAFELKTEWAVRPNDLMRELLRFQPHIVHFSGHGSKNQEIILENEQGLGQAVGKQALTDLFKALKDNVRIVVLNSCYSQPQAEALSQVIDFTVGTSQAVKDRSAVAFAAAFYGTLAFGRSVQTAFDVARTAISLNGLSGSDIPVLLVREGVSPDTPFLNVMSSNYGRGGSEGGGAEPDNQGGVRIQGKAWIKGDVIGRDQNVYKR